MFYNSQYLPLLANAPQLQQTTPLLPMPNGLVGDPENPMAKEMRLRGKTILPYDNQPASLIAKNAATKVGINPSLLFSSAWQEGLNKMAYQPERDKIAKYLQDNKMNTEGYPVDGYQYYGLDTFGDKAQDLIKKGYLPSDFASHFKAVPMYNDHTKKVDGKTVDDPQPINSAAFKTNEDALMAKAAMIKDSAANVQAYAKKKGITLDDNAANYFTLAAYNAGQGNAQKMLDDYANEKDKKGFIQNGGKNWQKLHANINPRLQNMQVANELLNEK